MDAAFFIFSAAFSTENLTLKEIPTLFKRTVETNFFLLYVAILVL